jgi:hypothetical protein
MAQSMLDPDRRRGLILAAVADRLSEPHAPWRIDGDRVQGPDPLAVITGDECGARSHNHIDLGVVVTASDGTATTQWDCALGLADDELVAIGQAVQVWSERTMPVFRELFAQDGSFADHYPGGDPDGIPGWHVIAGAFTGWGAGAAPHALRRWVVEHPLLPRLPSLPEALDRDALNGVRIFIGGVTGNDFAEVRVNGRVHRAASRELYELPWPRADKPATLSTYVLAVHRTD